jgi:hypothetical protein
MGNSGKIHSVTPLFIGGTGRSGTTVLGDLLNEHSLVRTSNPTEIKFLANRGGFLDVVFGSMSSQLEKREKISIFHYRTYRQRAQKDLMQRRERFEEFSEKMWQKWWEIDAPAPHGPGLHAGISKQDLQSLLDKYASSIKKSPIIQARKLMQGFIAQQKGGKGEKFWAETTPMNITYSHRLIKLFPEAKFIVIRRDPRDVIASLLTKNWGPNTPAEGVEWIEARIRADHEALKSVPKNQVLFINLEDLVTNSPQESYNKLLNFLQLHDEAAMRAFRTNKMTAENASSGRWKKEINDHEFEAAIDAMNQRLKKESII